MIDIYGIWNAIEGFEELGCENIFPANVESRSGIVQDLVLPWNFVGGLSL